MREAAGASALERAADAGCSGVEVDVFPVEVQECTLAESGAQSEFVQRMQPVGAGSVEELAGLGGSEWPVALGPGCGGS